MRCLFSAAATTKAYQIHTHGESHTEHSLTVNLAGADTHTSMHARSMFIFFSAYFCFYLSFFSHSQNMSEAKIELSLGIDMSYLNIFHSANFFVIPADETNRKKMQAKNEMIKLNCNG